MKVYKSLVNKSVTRVFKAFSHLKMAFASATMWPVWLRELESPVTRTRGYTSTTEHPGASKLYCFLTGTCINLFLWLNWCGLKRNTAMSSWMACNMKSMEIIRHLKMVVFLMGLQDGFNKFPCYPSYHIAGLQTKHRGQKSLMEKEQCQIGGNVGPRKVSFPSIYIKLGLMKKIVA